MDAPHIHLLLNHFPVIGISIGVLILAFGFFLKNDSVKNVAFGVFILTALVSIPVFFSGGQAEEILEKQAGFPEAYMEEHEEAAEKAIWVVELLGVVAILSLFFSLKENPYKKHLAIVTFVFALIAFASMARVNNAGGMMMHPEIRNGAAPAGSGETREDNDD